MSPLRLRSTLKRHCPSVPPPSADAHARQHTRRRGWLVLALERGLGEALLPDDDHQGASTAWLAGCSSDKLRIRFDAPVRRARCTRPQAGARGAAPAEAALLHVACAHIPPDAVRPGDGYGRRQGLHDARY
ncbi:hypothetical protein ACP4OV_021915 [Aristida adscensionis]